MRMREIIEGARLNPEFQRWFSGSKVVDKLGNPLRCYHGTFQDVERPWRPLTHFGTGKAASDRIDAQKYDDYEDDDETVELIRDPRIYPVYLKIKNPIRVVDDADEFDGDQTIWQALKKMVGKKLLTKNQYHDILRGGAWDDEEISRLKAVEILTNFGFDGLVYRNKREHVGSTSWVIFRDNQVWSAFS